MNIRRLQERVSSAKKFTNAYLKGYVFVCNKVSKDGSAKANVILSDSEENVVWGVLFVINQNEKSLLDKAEGLGSGYGEKVLTFYDVQGTQHLAQIYIADDKHTNDSLKPYDWYRAYILSGAIQNKLPDNYIKFLENLKFNIDINATRRNKNFAMLNSEK
jgi:hypothetical protein